MPNVYRVERFVENPDIVLAKEYIDPGQLPQFVVSVFCRQTAEIEAGKREPVIRAGNLSAKRDFTDVRDIVRAYGMLAEKGRCGETYNVGSGRAVEIMAVLDMILSQSSAVISVETDTNRMRPPDVPVIRADIGKITADTGWKPEKVIAETIGDILNYWRRSI